MDIKTTAVAYYGAQLQRQSQEVQGLGYSLCSIGADIQNAMPRTASAYELHNLAGTAARLKSQMEETLQCVMRLLYEAEKVAPKDQSTRY